MAFEAYEDEPSPQTEFRAGDFVEESMAKFYMGLQNVVSQNKFKELVLGDLFVNSPFGMSQEEYAEYKKEEIERIQREITARLGDDAAIFENKKLDESKELENQRDQGLLTESEYESALNEIEKHYRSKLSNEELRTMDDMFNAMMEGKSRIFLNDGRDEFIKGKDDEDDEDDDSSDNLPPLIKKM